MYIAVWIRLSFIYTSQAVLKVLKLAKCTAKNIKFSNK